MKANETVQAAQASQRTEPAGTIPSGRSLLLGSTFWGWAGPVLIMLLGGFLRFYRLSTPDAVVFDETYYVPDANSILHHGVEFAHVNKVNNLLVAGNPNFYQHSHGQLVPEIVAHPPLGKIMMAVGQWIFGLTPFGWRFTVALIGTVCILMLARITRRLTGSTMLGCVAGLLVIDRDRIRARLAAAATAGTYPTSGPKLGIRWLRVAAGLCLGCAVASKWNGLWYLAAFAGLAVAWDLGARRAAGFRDWLTSGLRSDAKWLPVWFIAAPLVIYAAAWSGWFANSNGYYRNWAATHGNHTPIWSTIDSWYQYNHWMLQFGLGLSSTHAYKSNPLGWTVLARPISFYWCAGNTVPRCGVKPNFAQEVLAIGTPLIWWGGTLALLFCLGWWLLGLIGDLAFSRLPRRDWRAGAVLLGVAAGWFPWIWYAWHDNRTEFYYYAIAFEPFMIIAITLCLGLIIGPARAAPGRRAVGAVAAGGYLVAVLLNFAYLYPVLTAEVIPYSAWLSRMWFSRWI